MKNNMEKNVASDTDFLLMLQQKMGYNSVDTTYVMYGITVVERPKESEEDNKDNNE